MLYVWSVCMCECMYFFYFITSMYLCNSVVAIQTSVVNVFARVLNISSVYLIIVFFSAFFILSCWLCVIHVFSVFFSLLSSLNVILRLQSDFNFSLLLCSSVRLPLSISLFAFCVTISQEVYLNSTQLIFCY